MTLTAMQAVLSWSPHVQVALLHDDPDVVEPGVDLGGGRLEVIYGKVQIGAAAMGGNFGNLAKVITHEAKFLARDVGDAFSSEDYQRQMTMAITTAVGACCHRFQGIA